MKDNNKKRKALIFLCLFLFLSSAAVIAESFFSSSDKKKDAFSDGDNHIDADTIILSDSGAAVSFSDVILSQRDETRKLIVFKTDATVTTEIEKSKIKNINLGIIQQNQSVTYTARGNFVVDLDELKEKNIKVDKDNKTVTIFIEHPHLDSIEIDPERIEIGDNRNGFLAFGDLTLSVSDYVELEKGLQKKLKAALDTSANGQEADDISLDMVKSIYEPVVRAVDKDYTVFVSFNLES